MRLLRFSITLLLLVLCGLALAQTTTARPAAPFTVPDDVTLRNVDIYSEGTRMAGDVYLAKANAGKKLPGRSCLLS